MAKHPNIVEQMRDSGIFDAVLYNQEGENLKVEAYLSDYRLEAVVSLPSSKKLHFYDLLVRRGDFIQDTTVIPETVLDFRGSKEGVDLSTILKVANVGLNWFSSMFKSPFAIYIESKKTKKNKYNKLRKNIIYL